LTPGLLLLSMSGYPAPAWAQDSRNSSLGFMEGRQTQSCR
jgi:hypothetical protein